VRWHLSDVPDCTSQFRQVTAQGRGSMLAEITNGYLPVDERRCRVGHATRIAAWLVGLMQLPVPILVTAVRHFGPAFALSLSRQKGSDICVLHLSTINAQTFRQSELCTNTGVFLVALVKRQHEVFGNHPACHTSRPMVLKRFVSPLLPQIALTRVTRHTIFRQKSLSKVLPTQSSTDVATWRQIHHNRFQDTVSM
jgi:hypothetical protein